MRKTKAAGLIYGPDLHHLDHLAPLCAILEIPLMVSEEEVYAQGRRYYPKLELLHFDYFTIGMELVSSFDLILTCLPRDLFDDAFLLPQKMMNRKIASIWCPHGNSDKGFKAPFFEALAKEKAVLVYGQNMVDRLKKKILEKLKCAIRVGNYRYMYFLSHQAFYEKLVEKEVFSRFQKKLPTLLYAPTWIDSEGSGSFFEICPKLVEQLPSHWNLLIKLHPNMYRTHPLKTDQLIWTCEDRPNIVFLNDFPPIYPLLEKVDAYLGDMSSIGYDFLIFDKPMFFLSGDRDHYLFRCGTRIPPEESGQIFPIIEKTIPGDRKDFSEIRKEVYQYTFDEVQHAAELKKRVGLACDLLVEEGLMFY